MKKFLTGCFILLILYAVAYDLKIGTLPQNQPVNAKVIDNKIKITQNKEEKYQMYEVKPGDTLISVVEKVNINGKYTIAGMLKDFKALNPRTDPEHIQIGKTYKFPLYKNK
ncbi:LysM domain-containing protein [Bacillus sp. NEB1478]|uniref:LysM peptidoglycan-binding domain-containing protein n=1 Tax=Bacillus sp. NEB1478 TaxID=3073816 RepID=UPI002873BB94|nr:LysM domain-containing protein [Bacillus sp. NEB1478]WNB93516.1 LysM domain-containing protein [Bacillus sp. NEB1478]